MSDNSPTTGPALAPDADAFAVGLVASPMRSLGWAVAMIAIGAVLLLKLSTVGQWLGGILVVFGAIGMVFTILAFMYPPGRIEIADGKVQLPRGRNRPHPRTVARADINAAYLLRKSTPWLRSSPVLVVEAGGQAYVYPRDWFASDADQRRVLDALRVGAAA